MNKVVDRIKYILNEKNMSVRELGRLTGIPQTTINRCLTSPDAKITLPKLEKIAAAIGVSPAYLMGWEDSDEIVDKEKPADEGELSEEVVIYHRDGKTVKKKFTKEQMRMIAQMLDAIPEEDE